MSTAPQRNAPNEQSAHEDAFARALFARLDAEGNLVASPASIEACVLLALAGARGETAAGIAKALQLPEGNIDIPALLSRCEDRMRLGKGKTKDALVIANSAWVQKGFPIEEAYRKLLEDVAHATFEQTDFEHETEAARLAINAWVDQQTRHKIKDLLARGSLDSSARLVLANAIYFRGGWQYEFPKQGTKDEPFLRAGKPPLSVPMMRRSARLRYLETDSYQAIELPYVESANAMVVWLPKKADGLADLEKSLLTASFGASLEKMATRQVDVLLPRFKFSSTASLADTLAAMGMSEAFKPTANFSGISEQKLMISEVVYQAVIEVDEVGTEAAAATAAIAVTASALPEREDPKVFRADHPFLFAIRNRTTGDILFLGRVVNPKE